MAALALLACGACDRPTVPEHPAAAQAAASAASAAASAAEPATVLSAASVSYPTLTYDDCPRLLAAAPARTDRSVEAADLRRVDELLQAVDPQHGGAIFQRLPQVFIAWMRGQPPGLQSLGIAVHETSHVLDAALSGLCGNDARARYFLEGTTAVSELKPDDTENLSIVAEVLPASFKQSERYRTYIEGSAAWNGNDFRVLLEELNAYVGGSLSESRLLASPACAALQCAREGGSANVDGMVEFMLFTEAYLKAARLNHAPTSARLRALPATLAHLQQLWSLAEQLLAGAYRFSLAADPLHGVIDVPRAMLLAVYADDGLRELDELGLRHLPRSAWAASYLK